MVRELRLVVLLLVVFELLPVVPEPAVLLVELDDDRDVDPAELRVLARPDPLEPGPLLVDPERLVPASLPAVPELLLVVRELLLEVLLLVVLELLPVVPDPAVLLVELDDEASASSSSSDGQLPGSGMPSIRFATYVEWPSRS